MSLVIIDYGLCNLDSVGRALEVAGSRATIESDPSSLKHASKIILPGVGNFTEAMNLMRARGWVEAIRETVNKEHIPLLGICLGMQLLADSSEEGAEPNQVSEGLGLIPGKITKMRAMSGERVPHVGWNTLEFTPQGRAHPMYRDIPEGKDFYFVHSYCFQPREEAHVLTRTPYGGGFASSVGADGVFGAQFHPEKSQRAGMQLLKNFIENF